MRQYRVWRDDGDGFIAEEIWGNMPESNGRYVAFLRARGKVQVTRQPSLLFALRNRGGTRVF